MGLKARHGQKCTVDGWTGSEDAIPLYLQSGVHYEQAQAYGMLNFERCRGKLGTSFELRGSLGKNAVVNSTDGQCKAWNETRQANSSCLPHQAAICFFVALHAGHNNISFALP